MTRPAKKAPGEPPDAFRLAFGVKTYLPMSFWMDLTISSILASRSW